MNKETDRELLKLAAKAVGFGQETKHGPCWTESIYPYKSNTNGALWNYIGHGDTAELWNPFTDDGDNARLESKLEFNVQWFDGGVLVGPSICGKENGEAYFEYFNKHNSKQAARRLAGVKAAAEIGRNIK